MVTGTTAVVYLCSTFPSGGAVPYSTWMRLGTLEAEFEFHEPLPPLCRRSIPLAIVGPVLPRLAKGTVWYGGLGAISSCDHSSLSVLRGAFYSLVTSWLLAPASLFAAIAATSPVPVAVVHVFLELSKFLQDHEKV